MTISYRGPLNIPNIVCLSSDEAGGMISGSQPGMIIYYSDTKTTKIVLADLSLADYVLPVEITVDPGDITIGAVSIDQSVAGAITLSPIHGTQDVAVPGTAEPLAATSTKVVMVAITARSTNTSTIYLGDGSVDKTSSQQMVLQPGASVSIDVPLGYNFSLSNLYIDSEIADDGVDYIAMR